MAQFVKTLARFCAHRDPLWRLVEGAFLKFTRHAVNARRDWETKTFSGNARPSSSAQNLTGAKEYVGVEEELKRLFPDMVVANGPFKGLKYPAVAAFGSAKFPKLLGSYEHELHPLIEEILATPYAHVLDIGCAEGYYANGFAKRLPQTRVHAYDINPKAVSFCRAMAELNDQADRIEIGSFCTAQTLTDFAYTGKSLIISDCEGFEKQLFTPAACLALAGHDVLIEVHDFIDLEISTVLKQNFAATHDIRVIQSLDDIAKIHQYSFPELAGYGLLARRELVGEYRPSIMEWYFCSPKVVV